jgi:hypothetical protein
LLGADVLRVDTEETLVGEVIAGLSAIKTALDMVKGLKDIDDATRRNAAIIELQEKILSAQEAQFALTEKVRDLEKEAVDLKTWHQEEKKKYDLKSVARGSYAYVRKEGMEPPEPPHWLCTNCYENGKKSILQYHHAVADRLTRDRGPVVDPAESVSLKCKDWAGIEFVVDQVPAVPMQVDAFGQLVGDDEDVRTESAAINVMKGTISRN